MAATAAATSSARRSRAVRRSPDVDARLVAGLRTRDGSALEQLFLAYGAMIANWARLDGQDPDDVVQEVLLKAWRYGPRLAEDTHLPAWLKTVTKNTVRNQIRTQSRKPQIPVGLEPNVVDVTDHTEPVTDRVLVEQALERLDPRERRCIELLYVADLPMGDVADRIGATEQATKSLAARARRRIRAELQKAPAAAGVGATGAAISQAAHAVGSGMLTKAATVAAAVLTAGALTLAAGGTAPSPDDAPAGGRSASSTPSADGTPTYVGAVPAALDAHLATLVAPADDAPPGSPTNADVPGDGTGQRVGRAAAEADDAPKEAVDARDVEATRTPCPPEGTGSDLWQPQAADDGPPSGASPPVARSDERAGGPRCSGDDADTR